MISGSIKSRRMIDKVKRKLAILLTLVMILSMLPPVTGIMNTPAYAADPAWRPGPREALVSNAAELRAALLSNGIDTIYLGADIDHTGTGNTMPTLAGGTSRPSLVIDGTDPRTDIKHTLTTNVSFRLGTLSNRVTDIKFQNIKLNQTTGATGFVTCANNTSAALGTTISFENASITVYRTVLPPGTTGTNNCNVNFKDCDIRTTNAGATGTRMICGRNIVFDGTSTIDSYSGTAQATFSVANQVNTSYGSTFTVKKGASLILVNYATARDPAVFYDMLGLEVSIEENALFFVVAGNMGWNVGTNNTTASFTVDRNAICILNLRGIRSRLRSKILTVNEGGILHLWGSTTYTTANRMALDAQRINLNSPFSVVFATSGTANNSLSRQNTELVANGLKSIRYFLRGEGTFSGYETTFVGDRRTDFRNWWFQQNGSFNINMAAPWGNQSSLSISTNYDPSKNTIPGATPNFVNTNFATTPIHCIQFDGGSRAPLVDTVYVGSRTVMGLGQPGAEIAVTWPTLTSDGTPIETLEPVSKTIVEPAGPYAPLGIWTVTVPEDIFLNISSIDLLTQVKVTQREIHVGLDRGESYPVYAPVVGTAMKIIGNNGRNIYYDLGTVPDKAEILFFGSGTTMKLEEGKGRYVLTNSLAALASPGNADVFEAVWNATPPALKGYIEPNEGTYWRSDLCNIPANCSVWAMADIKMGGSEETTRVHDVINYSNLFIRREIMLRLVDGTPAAYSEISPYTTIPGNYGVPYTLSGTVLTGPTVRYNRVNLALDPYMSDYWTATTKTNLEAPIPITLDANFPAAYLDISDDPTGSAYTLFLDRVKDLWTQVPMAYVDREGKPIPDSSGEPTFIWVPLDILEEEGDDEEGGDTDPGPPVADITSSDFLLRGGRFIPQKHHPFTPVGYYVNINSIDVREEPPGDPAQLSLCADFSKDFDPQLTDAKAVPPEKIYIVYDEGITGIKEVHKFIEDIDGDPIYPERNSIARIETGKPPIVYTAPKVAGFVPVGWEINNLSNFYSGEFKYDPANPDHYVTMDQNGHVSVELTPEMIAGGFNPPLPEEMEILWLYARDLNNNGIPDDEEVRINVYWYGMYPDSPYPAHLDNITIASRFGYELTVANDGLTGNDDHKIEIDSGRAAGVWLFDPSLLDNEALVTITPPDATPQTIEFLYGPRDVYPGYVMVTVIGKSGDTELYRYKTQYLEHTGNIRVYGFEVKGYNLTTASPVDLDVQDRDLEVIFDYDSLATTVTILMVDEGDNNLLPPIIAAAEAGAPFTYNAPHIPNYSLLYPAESTIGYIAAVADDSTSVIKFVYKLITSKLTIVCKEDNDKGPIIRVVEIPELLWENGFNDYMAPDLSNDFFTVKPGSEQITIYWDGANAASGEAYYIKELVDITINKFDVTDPLIREPILPANIISGQRRGEAVTINAPNIAEMVLVSPVSKTVIASPGRTVDFDYRQIADDEVAVKALDKETGNTLLSYIVSGIPNEKIYADAPTLAGWSLDGSETRKSAIIGTNKEIVFYYVKSIVKVTVEAIHISSGRIIQSTDYEVPRFSNYTAFSPNISGYVLNGDNTQSFTNLTVDTKASFYYKTITEVYDEFYIPITIRGINPIVGALYSYTKRIAQDQLPYTLIDGVDVFTMKGYTLDPGQDHLVSEAVKPGDVFEFRYTSTAGTVMITMIDQDSGAAIKDSYPVEAEVDKPFTYHAPYISGYRVVGDNPITIDSVLPAGASEIIFEYVKINSKVVIHYKEIDNEGKVIRTIRTIEIIDPEVDEETEVKTPDLDAPDYYTAQQTSVSYLFNGEDSVEVDAYYKKNLVNVTVRMVDFFDIAKKIEDDHIIEGNRQGEATEIKAPHVTGWILADDDTKTIIPGEDSVVVFKYREQEKYEVQVEAVVEDSGETLQKYTLSGREGDSVTVWAPIILGWKLVDETANNKEVVIGKDYDAIFYYEKNVATITVHAMHLTDTEEIVIDPEITYEVPKGGRITIYAPHIDGYVISGIDKETLSSVAYDGDIYFFYLTVAEKEAQSNVNITIAGRNRLTGAILYSYTKRIAKSDMPYELQKDLDLFAVPGFTLDEDQDFEVKDNGVKTYYFDYTSTEGYVQIKMIEEDTDLLLDSFNAPAVIGEALTCKAPYLPGYRLVSDSEVIINPVLPDGKSEAIFKYVKINSKITVEYREDSPSGALIRTDEITDDTIGENLPFTPPLTLPGYYNLIRPSYDTLYYSFNGSDAVTIIACYTKNLVSVTVNKISLHDSTDIEEPHQISGLRQGEAATITAPRIDDWVLVGSNTQTVVMETGAEEVTFIYRTQEAGEVQVKAIAKDTDRLLQSYTLPGTLGDEVFVIAPIIMGWKLADPTESPKLVKIGDDKEVIFEYEKDVVIVTVKTEHWESHAPLQDPLEIEVAKGGEATIFAPHIPGHIIVDADRYSWPSLGGNVEITFYYKKVSELVTITIIGQSGSTMLYRYEKLVPVDSGNTEIQAFEVKGYSLKGDSPITVNVKEKNETVIFEYDSLATTVTIRMVDDKDPTKNVAAPFAVAAEAGSPFTYNAPDVAGYYLTSESTIGILDPVVAGDTNVITFKYAKITSLLTIICKEENTGGRVIRVVEIPTAGLDAGTYEYDAPDLLTKDFYTAKAGSEKVSITWDGITAASVEAYYSKVMVDITIDLLDVTDPEEPELIRSESLSARKGEAVTVGAPDVSLMVLVGPAAKTVIALDDTVVEFGYRELNDDEVAVKAIYKDSADKAIILQSYVLSGAINETVYADAPTILGWVLKDPAENRKSAQIGRDKEIIFEYVKNVVEVTIKAVHKTTRDTIQPQLVVEVPKNGSYTAYAPHIAGYVIEGASTKSFIGLSGNAEATFEYLKVGEIASLYMVTIEVIGSSGNTELYRYDKTVPENSGITEIHAFNVRGYRLAETATTPVPVDVKESRETVTFEYESLATTVKIRMVNSANNEIATPFNVAAEAGSPFTYNAPNVAGYYLKDGESTIGTLLEVKSDGTSEISFKYDQITSKATIICKEDGNGRVIKVVEVDEAVLVGGENDLDVPNLENDYYTPVAAKVKINWNPSTSVSVDAFYTKDLEDIAIKLIDVSISGSPVPLRTEYLEDQRKGEAVIVGAPNVDEMILVDEATKTVIALDDATVEFRYRNVTETEVAVKAVDEATNTILQSYVMSSAVGSTVTANAPTMLGWKLTNLSERSKSVIVGSVKEIVFYYEKDVVEVTINLIHKTGNTAIIPPTVVEVPRNGNYKAYAPHIAGYVLNGEDTKDFIGLNENAEATFEYLKVGEIASLYMVTIEVIGESGNTELYRYNKTVPVNSGITEIHAFNVRGYRLAESATTPASVDVKESSETVRFEYDSLATTVKIRMVNSAGNDIATAFNVAAEAGSPFTYNAPNVSGYYLEDEENSIGVVDAVKSDGTSEISFKYAPVTSMVTIICKETGNDRVIRVVEVDQDTLIEGENDLDVPILEDDYYTPVLPQVKINWNNNSSVSVDAYYTKDKEDITIELIDVSISGMPVLLREEYLPDQRKGEAVTVAAPNVIEMILVDEATKTVIALNDPKVEFRYRDITDTEVAVKAIDGATNTILQSYVMSSTFGSTVTASAPTMLGWKLIGSENSKSVIVGLVKEIVFSYEKDVVEVTINLIHKTDNTPIVPPAVVEVPRNGNYKAYAPHITGYVISGDDTKDFLGLNENKEVAFEYLTVGEIALLYLAKIEVIGYCGPTELYRYDKLLPINSGMTEIHAFNVRGYRLADPTSTPAPVDVTEGTKTVVFEYESLATSVKIRMVNSAGNDIATPFNVAAEIGSPFTYNAPNVSGYYLKDGESTIGVVAEVEANGTSEISFKYDQITSKATIICKEDENGRVIRVVEVDETTLVEGENDLDVPILEDDYYTPVLPQVKITWNNNTSVSVEAFYTKDKEDITIEMIDASISGSPVLLETKYLRDQRKGEAVTVGAPDYKDMILLDEAAKTVIALNDPKVEFRYRYVTETEVAVKAVDDATKTILQSYVMSSPIGTTLTASAPTMLGWKLIGSENSKSVIVGPVKEIVFYYEKDVVEVTINLIHKTDSTPIVPPTVVEVPRNGNYKAYAPHITGYVISGEDTKNFLGLNENKEVTFTYITLQEATHNFVTVTVIGKSGTTQLYYYDMMLPKGSGDKEIHALEIKGYSLSDPDSSPVTLNIQEANETVIFDYDSLATTVTIKMVDEVSGEDLVGSPITEIAEVGSPFTYNAPDVEGYYLTSESTIGALDPVVAGGPNLIIFEYAEITSKLIIICKEDGPSGRVIRVVQVDEDECVAGENEILVPDLSNDYYTPLADTITFEWDGINSLVLSAYYTKNLVKITINMYNVTDPDPDKHELIGTKEISGLRQGEAVTVGAPDVEDMILVGPAAKTVIANPGVTVSFNYREIADDEVAVKAVAEDNTILLSYIIKGTIGETVSATAPVIPGWTLKDSEQTKSAVVGADKEIRFNYARTVVETVRVTIYYHDTDGNSIKATKTEEVVKGSDYTVYAPPISGYDLNEGTDDKVELTGLASDKTVTFVYKEAGGLPPVTTVIIYLRNTTLTGAIVETKTFTNLFVGHSFDPLKYVDDSFITGSTSLTRWDRDKTQTVSAITLQPLATGGGTPNIVNILYKGTAISTGGSGSGSGGGASPTPDATLIVRAKDVKTGETIYEQSTPAYSGKTQTIKAPSIAGYTLDASSAASQNVTIRSGEQVVTFNYNFIGATAKGSYNLKETLETDKHIAYLSGYPNGTVRPDGSITRAEAAMIFWRLLRTSDKSSTVGTRFRDVKDGQWYSQAVSYLATMGILLGYPDGTFRPNQRITRAEFTTIAARFDSLITDVANPFSDLKASHWASQYILSAYSKGWVTGYADGSFKPSATINRGEAVAIVNRMLGRVLTIDEVPAEFYTLYSDLPTTHWAFSDIIEASVEHEHEYKSDGTEVWTKW